MRNIKTKPITISIPQNIASMVDEIVKKEPTYKKKSHLFTDALMEYLQVHYPEYIVKKAAMPAVLVSIKTRQRVHAPSPTLSGRIKIEGFRIEE